MTSPTKPSARRKRSNVVRRSVALPTRLVEQVSEAAPPEYRGNLNAVVRTALEEYVRNRRREAFDEEMERMAADPQIRAENEAIHREFEGTLADGLPPA